MSTLTTGPTLGSIELFDVTMLESMRHGVQYYSSHKIFANKSFQLQQVLPSDRYLSWFSLAFNFSDCGSFQFLAGAILLFLPILADNGLNPVWWVKFDVDVINPALAYLRFVVNDEDMFGEPNFIGHAIFPMNSLKTGMYSNGNFLKKLLRN